MYNYVNSFDPPNNRKVLLVDRQKRNLRLSELTTRLGESRALNKAAAAKGHSLSPGVASDDLG